MMYRYVQPSSRAAEHVTVAAVVGLAVKQCDTHVGVEERALGQDQWRADWLGLSDISISKFAIGHGAAANLSHKQPDDGTKDLSDVHVVEVSCSVLSTTVDRSVYILSNR